MNASLSKIIDQKEKLNMKHNSGFYVACTMTMVLAIQAMNQTSSSVNNTSTDGNYREAEESFYTVDVLLTADAAVSKKIR